MNKNKQKMTNANKSFEEAIKHNFSTGVKSTPPPPPPPPPPKNDDDEFFYPVSPNFNPKSTTITTAGGKKKFCPIVSVCTPTFNRRPFIEMMFECFRNQNYPKNSIEWIIVDDGTDPIQDLIEKSEINQIKYYKISKKMSLGKKRNFMHTKCSGTIIVYMDDDDYYPPDRISHSVEKLLENKNALCAGSSEIYIYFKHIQKMIQCGPYNQNHATAGTFAFKSELLKQTKYDDDAALAEEKSFLKNYTIPFVQLDPLKTILVFSHNHNTFDKKKMLENMHKDFCKESSKPVSMFIRGKNTEKIQKFFLEEIDGLLEKYDFGNPQHKPDVLENIKKIDKERKELAATNPANTGQKIMMKQPDGTERELTPQDLINIIQQQNQQIQQLTQELDNFRKI
jgi:glycosyltransferase involved in cell wall biosynthesis